VIDIRKKNPGAFFDGGEGSRFIRDFLAMSIVLDYRRGIGKSISMATSFEDVDVQGNLTCNGATVRGALVVAGVPVGLGVNVQDEGTALVGNPHAAMNFVGGGVTATDVGGVATVTIPGGVAVQDEGAPLANSPHAAVNFVGGGVTATDVGGVATVTIPGGVAVQDEGTPLANNPHAAMNFVGGGVTATDVGGVATVTIPGGVGVAVQDEGTPLANNPHAAMNFVGGGVTATDVGGVATVTIPGGMAIQNQGSALPTNPYKLINFRGNGVAATDGPPGGNADVTIPLAALLVWGADDIGGDADTRFLGPGSVAIAGSLDNRRIPIVFQSASALRCLYVRHGVANGNGASVVYTVLVNGVATALTVTLATAAVGQARDIVHEVAIAPGDVVSIQVAKATPIGLGALNVYAVLEVE
jgi:hypothetical protein